jgi:thiamine-phosphate pyrophosphorylase
MYNNIQYISQGNTAEEQVYNIHNVLDAGFKWIQLRFKNQEESALAALAEKVKQLCDTYRATFIMNDHVEIARTVDASGVHLGLSDTPIVEARALLGNKKIIGGTANTLQDVLQRMDENCDYIGLGPYRFTTTKEKLSPVLGLEGYSAIMNVLKEQNKQIPVYAIGGIMQDDLEGLLQLGIHGIAVSGLLTNDATREQFLQTKSFIPAS